MGERRHRDSRLGSPPWHRSCERDPGIRPTERFSPSYLSPTPVWPGHDCSRLVSRREEPIYGGDVRYISSSVPRNPESEKYRTNQCVSGLNRLNDSVLPETGGLVQRGECGEKRDAQRQIMAGFKESTLGMGKNSTFTKFQWDNLLVDKKPIHADANRENFGSFCDSSVVPVSLPMEYDGGGSSRICLMRGMKPTDSSRYHGLVNGGCASSSMFGKFGATRKRTSIVDSIVDKIEGANDIDNGVYIHNDTSFRNNGMSDRRILLENDTSFVEDDKDVDYWSLNAIPENLSFIDELSFQRHSSDEDAFETVPNSYRQSDSPGSSYQQLIRLQEPLEMRLQRNPSLDMETSSDWNDYNVTPDSASGGDGCWTSEDIEQLAMLESSRWEQYPGMNTEYLIDEISAHDYSLSSPDVLRLLPRRAKPTNKPYKSDVRQRLGPALSVKHRLGPALSVKHRLGPALSVRHRLGLAPLVGKRSRIDSKVKKKVPWVKMMQEKTLEDLEQNINVQGKKLSDLKTKKCVKIEPPEDSEEFKHMVQSAFLKFAKVLNENSANRRKYLEQGRAGCLKCSICGSSSKDFADTLSLAQHAFFSWKVGSRSEHLGLYKAICVLMGWNSTICSNGRWIQQILPLAEASLFREDLIIWPPVVLIHNSSIANDNQDKRMIVGIEGLKHILRGMGCGRWMANLCCRKAANYSTMVVSFSGTFSGLREAERLHELFGEKKHGRMEFQQINFSGCKMDYQETQNVRVDDMESFLYGYMGIASDLDKLDSETKKKCVVRSKKEIAAIADANLNTE